MSGRPRKRVEEEAAAEEAWTLDNYAWDPQQCVARKRTKTTEGALRPGSRWSGWRLG